MTDLVLAFVSFIFMLVLSCFCLATVSRCIEIYIIKINQLSVLCSACDLAHEPPTHPPSATRTRAEDLYIKLLLSNVLHLNLTPSGLNRGSGGAADIRQYGPSTFTPPVRYRGEVMQLADLVQSSQVRIYRSRHVARIKCTA